MRTSNKLGAIACELLAASEGAPDEARRRARWLSNLLLLIRGVSAADAQVILGRLGGFYPPRDCDEFFTLGENNFHDARLPLELARLNTAVGPDGTLEASLDGFLSGWSLDPAAALKQIADSPKVVMKIDSLGGSTSVALRLHDALAAHPDATTDITSCAFSAALVVAQGARWRKMASSAWTSIHAPTTDVVGDAVCLSDCARSLEVTSTQIAEIFQKRSGQPMERIREWLSDRRTVYFDATKSLELGLVDEVYEAAQPPAQADASPAAPDPDAGMEAFTTALLAKLKPLFKDQNRFRQICQSIS